MFSGDSLAVIQIVYEVGDQILHLNRLFLSVSFQIRQEYSSFLGFVVHVLIVHKWGVFVYSSGSDCIYWFEESCRSNGKYFGRVNSLSGILLMWDLLVGGH